MSVVVVGAGLVGCLSSLAFAQKGYKVKLYEGREDIRVAKRQNNGKSVLLRSINLALSARGINALEYVDKEMADRVMSETIPMYGRMVHDLEGNQSSQNYGLYGESINSIDRGKLNETMLDEAEKHPNVEIFFGHKLADGDFEGPSLKFQKEKDEEEFHVLNAEDIITVIGADGSYSKIRQLMQRSILMDYKQEYIDHLYLELRIPPGGENGEFLLDPNHLHIWPRHSYMLIALANQDGSFTSTLFAPKSIFDTLISGEKMIGFFEENFPDALELIGRDALLQFYYNNPRASLISITCNPYNVQGKGVLLGDAAHSMVPFYGQGLNCGFEDVYTLMELLEKHEFNMDRAFDDYTVNRHNDLVAIIDLAMENYEEMRHKVTSTTYLIRKHLDEWLSRTFKDGWLSLYTMVSFRPDISYSQAVRKEAWQQSIIQTILTNTVNLTLGSGLLWASLWFMKKYNTSKP